MTEFDSVSKPKHYNSHPSGIQCIEISEHMNFCLGNVMKYIWRSEHKNGLEDLKKAAWYLNREIERRTKEALVDSTPSTISRAEGPNA